MTATPAPDDDTLTMGAGSEVGNWKRPDGEHCCAISRVGTADPITDTATKRVTQRVSVYFKHEDGSEIRRAYSKLLTPGSKLYTEVVLNAIGPIPQGTSFSLSGHLVGRRVHVFVMTEPAKRGNGMFPNVKGVKPCNHGSVPVAAPAPVAVAVTAPVAVVAPTPIIWVAPPLPVTAPLAAIAPVAAAAPAPAPEGDIRADRDELVAAVKALDLKGKGVSEETLVDALDWSKRQTGRMLKMADEAGLIFNSAKRGDPKWRFTMGAK